MQTLRVSVCVFIGLLVAVPVVKATPTACGFDLEARAAATRVLVGEPILIQVVLKNRTSTSAEIIPVPRRPFHIEFSRDGQTYERFWAYERILTGPRRGPVLKPGQELRHRELLVRNVRNVLKPPVAYDYPLFERGVGHIRVGVELRVDGERKAIVSEPIRVEVSEPVGADREVWERVRQQHWWAPLLQQIGLVDSDVSVEAQIEQLLKEYASTVYVHHLALALGRHYQGRAYGIPLGGGDGERARYLQRAREYFELAARMEQVPWVREEAHLEWGRFLAHHGRAAEAVAVAKRGLALFPEGMLAPELRQLAQMPVEPAWKAADRELAAQGYDLSELTSDQVAQLRAYMWERDEQWNRSGPHSFEQEEEEAARRKKEWVRRHLKPKPMVFSPDPFGEVQDELKALGYDLSAMTEEQLRDYDAYVDGTLEKARAANPGMSDLEYLTLQAKLIREWVMKNLKPVRPAQTNEVGGVVVPLE